MLITFDQFTLKIIFYTNTNIVDTGDTEDRLVWYTSNLFVSQLKKSKNYKDLSKTIGVIIFNYELPSLIDVEEGKKETARKLLEKEITIYRSFINRRL